MASLWEIREPSALTYNTKLGFVTADSGSGPPANFSGWIRTGNISNTSTIAGSANCAVWSSNGSSDHGTNVFLSAFWTEAAVGISPWASENVQCSSTFHVWCVAGK
jgi:hypothetical protein